MPACERSIERLRFKDFPTEGGLWWLRWIDYDSDGGATGSSYLRVTFTRLHGCSVDDLPMLDEALAARGAASQPVQIHVGWLPILSIGLVARDGFVVGQLGRDVRTFVFDRRHIRADVFLTTP